MAGDKNTKITPVGTVLTITINPILQQPMMYVLDFPSGSNSNESACNAGDPGSIPGLGKSAREGNGNPIPGFLPREFHGQRSLAGYSPWGHKESDTTERLTHMMRVLLSSLCCMWENYSTGMLVANKRSYRK